MMINFSGFKNTPIMRQSEAAECGLACVGMVAAYHGFRSDMPSLRRRFSISMKGATLDTIAGIANSIHLGARAIRCELEELREVRCPAILHWNLAHYVVLIKASKTHITINDPAHGRITLTLDKASKHFTGVALELKPTAKFEKRKERVPLKLSSMIKPDKAVWKALGQALVLSFVLQILGLVSPYYMQLILDEVIPRSDSEMLATVTIGFLLLSLFSIGAGALRSLISQFITHILGHDMEVRTLGHMIRLPLSYFHQRHIGDIQQRFSSVLRVQSVIIGGAFTSILDGMFAIVLGVVIYLYSPLLASLVVGLLILNTALQFAVVPINKRLALDSITAGTKESSNFLETLRAMQTIKVGGGEQAREMHWQNLATETINADIRAGNFSIGYGSFAGTIGAMGETAITFIAVLAAVNGDLSIGAVIAFLAYKSQFEGRVSGLLNLMVELKLLEVDLERVADIAFAEPETSLNKSSMRRQLTGRIEVRNVSFQYADKEPFILRNANLTIEPGEFVVLAAPSGRGKSTLLRLLLGLYEQTEGEILYDGQKSTELGLGHLRRQMGVVMQDDTLLSGSIEENIAFFDEDFDSERVRWAAERAAIHNEIVDMPMSYSTLVGDMGSTLSGGQKQRVMLARALYKKPQLLVMDEGTSQLDVATERRINSMLSELSITRIAAAHRPETIASADRVITLMDGELVEISANASYVSTTDSRTLEASVHPASLLEQG